ncbi:unnamed protein product [Linum trigynum]|uniref:Uncharacterized protein n=1 Tax=Linum trigynum TaxID=586398 RepID=A0AAV2CTP9_9ROSI
MFGLVTKLTALPSLRRWLDRTLRISDQLITCRLEMPRLLAMDAPRTTFRSARIVGKGTTLALKGGNVDLGMRVMREAPLLFLVGHHLIGGTKSRSGLHREKLIADDRIIVIPSKKEI